MASRGQKIVEMAKNAHHLTSLAAENGGNTPKSIESAVILMDLSPAKDSLEYTTATPHKHDVIIVATGSENDTNTVYPLNADDLFNATNVNNLDNLLLQDMLEQQDDYSSEAENLPNQTDVQVIAIEKGGEIVQNANQVVSTKTITILQDILIENNSNEPDYTEEDGETNNLQHADESFDVDDPPYQTEESSDEAEESSNEGKECKEEEERDVRNQQSKGKKRKRSELNWKKNIRKKRKAAGKEYLSSKHKVIRKKKMKEPCNESCRKKCSQKITNEDRVMLHTQYWNSDLENDQKRQFISSCIEQVPVQRVRVRTGSRIGKRTSSLNYFFTVNNKKISVCRTYFLNTLNISQTTVRFALKKRQVSGVVTSDQRGKHEPANKIDAATRNKVREHIQKFPCIESHYSRNKSERKYLGSHLNISKMYEFFHEECLANQLPEAAIPKQWLYAEIFNTEFNLSFKEPGNDTCDQCDEFTVKLKETVTQEERQEIERKYDAHLLDADNRYKLKRQDKEASRTMTNNKVLTVDLQKCLPTPLLKNAQSFYSLKLWTFNYTVYDATEKLASCFVWDESIAGRGGNEMASCLLKYICGLKDSVKKIIIWSDNCPSQNRNQQMIMFYFAIFKLKPSLECIEHKFLLRGHTHMEVDTIHAKIEKQKKASHDFSIVTPWDWQQLMRLCGPKVAVEEMQTQDFYNFNRLNDSSTSLFQLNKKTTNNKNFLISKVVHMKFLAHEIGVLHFKTDFEQENFEQVDFNKPTKRVSRNFGHTNDALNLQPMRNTLKPIATKKWNDLQKLLKWVPVRFHDFFKNLPHETNVKDAD